jgi:hypothetical protein
MEQAMAGTFDDNSIPRGPQLLCNLHRFVSKCLGQSEKAAEKFLLGHLATERNIKWRFEAEIEAPRCAWGTDSIPPTGQEFDAISLFFWKGRKHGQFEVDCAASSASYDGPMIRVESSPNGRGGHFLSARFDGRWLVRINVSLIRIDPTSIIKKLDSLGLLLPLVGQPTASEAPDSCDIAIAQPITPQASTASQDEADDETKISPVAWLREKAWRMKEAEEIPADLRKTDLMKVFHARMKVANSQPNSKVRLVSLGHIMNEANGWGLWPVSEIKEPTIKVKSKGAYFDA